ncbi:hypothetical protein MPH_03954 [Macrophomina phaseolina MS6]|uniref:HypA-like protein n=1 Tax=Macrophomina phaseolina (strain MS6) TaxID=1126212 RepID=K2RVF6_MACPH|nr:hypothetical protein MPH_03954 [Macrophomina phaseolina MS6]
MRLFPLAERELRKTMATTTKIHLTTSEKPAFFVAPLREESAKKASELLQENHEKHHIYFNKEGFHNHIVHHLLTLYALGATPAQIQDGYTQNAGYQRPPVALDPHLAQDLSNPATFAKHLGDERHYRDYLLHFQREIDAKGVAAVLAEYLFARDKRADDLLARTFAGLVHPLIHMGFGVEFAQPAIVAEGLAQAATHDAWIGAFLLGAERAAEGKRGAGKGATLMQLIEEIRGNEKLARAARWEDKNRLRDGVIGRAGKEMCELAAKWTVDSDEELERRTAEMIDASVFFSVAAQKPPHTPKIDFFYMHSVTSSIFFSDFLSNPLFPRDARARMLEWKARFDLANYASRGAPALAANELADYVPRNPSDGWDRLFQRVNGFSSDDGHAAKLLRGIANGEQAWKRLGEEQRKGFAITSAEQWWKACAMGMDGTETGGPRWVRSTGFEEAWKDVPLREEGNRAAPQL